MDFFQRRSEPTSPLTGSQIRHGMRVSIFDGIFAVPYVTLTSGPILIAFLLVLGANTAQIGLVSMLPLAGGLLQPLGAQLVKRSNGWRRPVAVTGAVLDDLLWGVTIVCVITLRPAAAIVAVVGVLAVQQILNAFVAVSWTSWMSDLVPASLRGRYFGRRNFICNAFGVVTAVAGGQFIHRMGDDELWSYCAVFIVAMFFRFLSIRLLARQPEPAPEQVETRRLRDQLMAPLASKEFRRFVQFGMTWGFAIQLVSPFFTVYLIRDLQITIGMVMVLAAISTIANLIGQRYWGPISDKFGHYQVMRITTLVVVFQPLWWLFVSNSGPGFILLFVVHVVGGFTWGGYQLSSGNLMMALSPTVGKSSFFGVQAALSGLGGAAGPLVGGILADTLFENVHLVGAAGASSLLSLFVLGLALRAGAWGLLLRVSEPTPKPQLRVAVMIGDMLRTSNITQGFSPLLHRFTKMTDDDRPLDEALDELSRDKTGDARRTMPEA